MPDVITNAGTEKEERQQNTIAPITAPKRNNPVKTFTLTDVRDFSNDTPINVTSNNSTQMPMPIDKSN